MVRTFRVISVIVILCLVFTTAIIPAKAFAPFNCSTVTDVTTLECEALVALYDSTGGSTWTDSTNWLSTTTVDDWKGVSVLDTHVVGTLDLYNNNLTGPIPPEIGDLTYLSYIYFPMNHLNGSIPAEISQMTALNYLYLYENDLTGSIPADLFSLPAIKELRLDTNHLSGQIPTTLGDAFLTLEKFSVSFNNLSGVLPNNIGDLQNLTYLTVAHNDLYGPIPTDMKDLSPSLYIDIGSSGFWSTDGEVIAYLDSVASSWASAQSAQGLYPKIGEIVGWGSPGFPPKLTFSKFFDNSGVAAEKYRFTINGVTDPKIFLLQEKPSADICPSTGSTIAATCEYIPGSGDWDYALVPGEYWWTVDTWSGSGWNNSDDTRYFTIAAPPAGNFPTGIISFKTPSFGWQEVAGAVSYNLVVESSTTGEILNETLPAGSCAEGSCQYHPIVSFILPDGEYTWKVRAQIGSLDYTDFNVPINFRKVAAPVAINPAGVITAKNPTFSWSVTPTATAYYLSIYKNGTFYWEKTINSPSCNSTTCSFTPYPNLNLGNANYYWKVMAQTTDWGDLSPNKNFSKVSPPAAKFPSISLTSTNPKFIWGKVAEQTKYRIILMSSSGTTLLDKILHSPVCDATTCSYTPSPALSLVNGAYKWKVSSYNGIWGDFSPIKAFNELTPPAPVSPTGTISMVNPVFKWKKIPGATMYFLVLQKASGVSVKQVTINAPTCTTYTCTYTFSPALTLAKGDYKWKVKAYNGYYGPYGVYMNFTKQ